MIFDFNTFPWSQKSTRIWVETGSGQQLSATRQAWSKEPAAHECMGYSIGPKCQCMWTIASRWIVALHIVPCRICTPQQTQVPMLTNFGAVAFKVMDQTLKFMTNWLQMANSRSLDFFLLPRNPWKALKVLLIYHKGDQRPSPVSARAESELFPLLLQHRDLNLDELL